MREGLMSPSKKALTAKALTAKECQSMTLEELDDILLDLSGRSELELSEVQLYYAVDRELERRGNE